MKKYKIYKTDRLLLKPTTEEDAEFMFELVNTTKWLKFIGDKNISDIDTAKEYIKNNILPQQNRLGYSVYTLIIKEEKVKIGTCGLYDRKGLNGIDIGFALLPEYEKKGYGIESAFKIIEIAFNIFNLNELSAITDKTNIDSQALLIKLGFKLNGTTMLPNEDEEILLYQLKK